MQYIRKRKGPATSNNPLNVIVEPKKFLKMFPKNKHVKETQNVLAYFNSTPDGYELTKEQSILQRNNG